MTDSNRNHLPRGTTNTRLLATGCAIFLLPLLLTFPTLSHGQDVKDIAPRLADAIAKCGKKTVAVVDFTDLQGRVTEFGRFLAEEFSVDLANNAKGFDVIDRTNLKTLLQEHKLAATGIIDPQTARRVGEIAGVQVLIAGTVVPFGESVRLSVKVLDAETARVISGVTADIPRNKAIDELLARGIAGGDQPTAVGDQTPNQPIDHKQAYHGSIGVATQGDYRTTPVPIVSAVVVGGPAEQAGIKAGDTLVSVDGKTEQGPELFADISSRKPGTKIRVGLMRNGQKEETTLTVAEHAEFFAEVTAEIGDMLFLVQGCRLTGGTGECWGTVTNRGPKDVYLNEEGRSYLIDNFGKQSTIPEWTPWGQKMHIWFGSGGSQVTLEPNLPISFFLKGESLSTDASSLSLVLATNQGKTTVKNIRVWHR